MPCWRNFKISDSSVKPLPNRTNTVQVTREKTQTAEEEGTEIVSVLVDADLLHLGDQHLQKSHDCLQRQFALPRDDLCTQSVS